MRPTEKEKYIAEVLKRTGKKRFAREYLNSSYRRYLAEKDASDSYTEIPD